MVWVKVCGVTSRDAAEAAVVAGADAIGFVLIDSPRRVSLETASRIGVGLDVERIALVEGPSVDDVMEQAGAVSATGLQVYGPNADAIAVAARAADYLVLRPVSADRREQLDAIPVDQLPLLDAGHPTLRGGTGQTFDWRIVGAIERPVVVAGGLAADNVADLMSVAAPWGVDASSRLESSPGRKDLSLVRAFVTAAKQERANR